LISKLEDEGKVFDLMIYPGGRHGWGGAKARHTNSEDQRHWIEWFNLKD
jgi:dipeptidyl-peptidase-4